MVDSADKPPVMIADAPEAGVTTAVTAQPIAKLSDIKSVSELKQWLRQEVLHQCQRHSLALLGGGALVVTVLVSSVAVMGLLNPGPIEKVEVRSSTRFAETGALKIDRVLSFWLLGALGVGCATGCLLLSQRLEKNRPAQPLPSAIKRQPMQWLKKAVKKQPPATQKIQPVVTVAASSPVQKAAGPLPPRFRPSNTQTPVRAANASVVPPQIFASATAPKARRPHLPNWQSAKTSSPRSPVASPPSQATQTTQMPPQLQRQRSAPQRSGNRPVVTVLPPEENHPLDWQNPPVPQSPPPAAASPPQREPTLAELMDIRKYKSLSSLL